MSSRDLKGWKAIATHLDVNVRTAQKWERERHLPVRRPPGGKGPVTATLHDLEAWQCTPPTPKGEPTCYRFPVSHDVTAEVRFTTNTITSDHIQRLQEHLTLIQTTLK